MGESLWYSFLLPKNFFHFPLDNRSLYVYTVHIR